MIIDALIPVWRPDARFLPVLRMLEHQRLPVRRILLLNTLAEDGSDPLAELLRSEGIQPEQFRKDNPSVTVIPVAHDAFDHGGTRAYGADQCTDADALLFMTQDAFPADDRLTEALSKALFAESAAPVAAVYARQLPWPDASVEECLTRGFNYPAQSAVRTAEDLPRLGIRTFFCSNVCAMYRNDIYRKRGGFVRHTVFNEDMIYASGAVRSGYAIAYAADARVYHSHSYTAKEQFRRNFDLGVSQACHPEVFGDVSSGGEGVKYVKRVTKELRAAGERRKIPGFLFRCAARYAGYTLGKHYTRVPMRLIRKWTMSPAYWTGERGN